MVPSLPYKVLIKRKFFKFLGHSINKVIEFSIENVFQLMFARNLHKSYKLPMRTILLLILIYTLFTVDFAYAHENHKHAENCCSPNVQIHQTAPETEEEAILRILNLFHYAIDGEHHHINSFNEFLKSFVQPETWKNLAQNLNLVKVGANAYRAYNIEKQHEINVRHARNMLMIYPISHGIEMASAPMFLVFSAVHDVSASTVAVVTPLLTAIAIPGLDILCILIFAAYPIKAVHKTIDTVVELFSRPIKNQIINKIPLERGAGIQRIVKNLNEITKVIPSTLAEGNFYKYSIYSFDQRGNKQVKYSFETKGNTTYLKEIHINNINQINYESAIAFSRTLMSFNAYYAVKEALENHQKQNLESYEKTFYVKRVVNKDTETEILFENRALIIPGLLQKKSCSSFFNTSY